MIKLSCVVVLSAAVLAPLSLSAQATQALTVLLNKQYLTPIPDSLSTYKPGALVVLKPKGTPDPADPEDDVEDMVVVPVTGLIPALTLTSADDFSVAATLFGFSPTTKFGKVTSLKSDPIVLSGWRLTTAETRAIQQKGSLTYKAAQDLYKRDHINWLLPTPKSVRSWSLYLIDSIYTTTSTNISSTDNTELAFSGGTLPTCSPSSTTTDTTKKSPTTSPTTTPTNTPATASAQNGNSSNTKASNSTASPSPTTNPIAADISALGTVATDVAQGVEGAPKTSATTKTATAVKDLLPVKLPTIAFCRTSGSTVSFTSDSPVPVAMILKRIGFLPDGSMTLNAETAKW